MIDLIENLDPNVLVGFLEEYLKDPYDIDNLKIAADYLQEINSPVGDYLQEILVAPIRNDNLFYKIRKYFNDKGIDFYGIDYSFNMVIGDDRYAIRQGTLQTIDTIARIIELEEVKDDINIVEGIFVLIANDLRQRMRLVSNPDNYREEVIEKHLYSHAVDVGMLLFAIDSDEVMYNEVMYNVYEQVIITHELLLFLRTHVNLLKNNETLQLLQRRLRFNFNFLRRTQRCHVTYFDTNYPLCDAINECMTIIRKIINNP